MVKFKKGLKRKHIKFGIGHLEATINEEMGELTLKEIAEHLFKQLGYKEGKVELLSINK